MQERAHLQCAGVAGTGMLCRSSCNPSTQNLASCLSMVKRRKRTTPPRSLNFTSTMTVGEPAAAD
eukprot:7376226-Prymnesium_polylepis.2